MEKLKVAFLWHLHQPQYRDAAGYCHFPWVYLYGLKDYGAMARLARETGARVTLNVTPCLLEQLSDYVTGRGYDPCWDLFGRDPEGMPTEERRYLQERYFSANYDRMVAPFPRYRELWEGRDRDLDDGELRDLMVLFHLAWLSPLWRAEKLVRDLVEQGRNFTGAQREALRSHCRGVLGAIEGELRRAAAGGTAISTSPFYHPILPLLCGEEGAPFRHSEDAGKQILLARRDHARRFGSEPRGMWPSEGALSSTTAELLRGCGLDWVATDEGLLHRVLGEGRPEEFFGGSHLYRQPYTYRGLKVFFRDRTLSDLVGFTYHSWPADAAADDLVGRLEVVAGRLAGGGGLVVLALDGENPWEYYAENGVPFLRRLYGRLADHPRLAMVNLDEACAGTGPELPQLPVGSWAGDLRTWIGHPEKNRAWDILSRARDDLGAPADVAEKSLLAAEGSDWFWWLGEDHYTADKEEFEALFRHHLADAYRGAGRPLPAFLASPVAEKPRWMGASPRLLELAPEAMAGGGFFRRLWVQENGSEGWRLLVQTNPPLPDLLRGGYRVVVRALGDEEYRRELEGNDEQPGEIRLPTGRWTTVVLTATGPAGEEEVRRVDL